MLSADEVSLEEFQEALDRYPAVIKAVPDSKGTKNGQKSLEALDEYRYAEAPGQFSLAASSPGTMGLEHVKSLVEWKLRHGKFRPTLMKLVTSNEPPTVAATILKAIAAYKSNSDAPAAVNTLATLRGIGPATASLLLAVHDPDRVVFFGDEVFYWLCCNGKVAPIKYDKKEYRQLQQRAEEVVERLGVKAVDVEKVAFVAMKGGDVGEEVKPAKAKAEGSTTAKTGKKSAPSATKDTAEKFAAGKRKHGSDNVKESDPEANSGLRRSKREKRA